MKRKIWIPIIMVLCLVVGIFSFFGWKAAQADSPDDMIDKFELALDDEYKKQSMTELIATMKYSDGEGNDINYHMLKTTYYEANPGDVTGLNVGALGVLFHPDSASNVEPMMIKDWPAARYEFDGLSYLCWTDSPEVSYVLEYDPQSVSDEEILKMAESAEKVEDN